MTTMHNLQLTEDQTMIFDTVKKLVQDLVAPNVLERDEHRQFLREEFDGLAELGLFAVSVAEEHGGAGMGMVPLVASCEEVGSQSGSLARLLGTQVQDGVALAEVGGGPLDEVLAGARLAVFLGPEHGIACSGGALTGACELVPGAAEADVFVVAASDGADPVLCVVDASASERVACNSLGLASTSPATVTFASAAAETLANGDGARTAIGKAVLAGHLAAAAACVGMGRACVELAHRHASERIAFGKPLLVQQAVARKLVESRRAVDAARHLVYHAARLDDLGESSSDAAAAARIAAVDACVLAADEGIQIHGGFGYTVEYHVERHYRDAKTLGVVDGGGEALRVGLAQAQFAG